MIYTELDRDLVEKLLQKDDAELKNGIEAVANAMGFEPKKLSPYLADMGKIKEMISGVTENDLNRIAKRIGEKESGEILSLIRKEAEK